MGDIDQTWKKSGPQYQGIMLIIDGLINVQNAMTNPQV